MNILGIQCSTHDYSMSLLYQWKIYTIELERLIWLKKWKFERGISKRSLKVHEEIVDKEHHILSCGRDTIRFWKFWVELMFEYLCDNLSIWLQDIDVVSIDSLDDYRYLFWNKIIPPCPSHHLLHAYWVFPFSWFTKSGIFIADGAWYNTETHKTELQSYFLAQKKQDTEPVFQQFEGKTLSMWLGRAYENMAMRLWLSAWKLMGLSWYGSQRTNYNFFENREWNVFLREEFQKLLNSEKDFFTYFFQNSIQKEKNWQLEKQVVDLAFNFQKEFEEALLTCLYFLKKNFPSENLCYAGWVALNCLANSRIKKEIGFKNLYVLPASHDGWISLWCLFYALHNTISQKIVNGYDFTSGITYQWELKREKWLYTSLIFTKISSQEKIAILSEHLQKDKIISIFQDGWEFWPRALGNRSILASPKTLWIAKKLNKIKDRESWRPFWMMVSKKNQSHFFDGAFDSLYMLFTQKPKNNTFDEVVHTDGTLRLQTILPENSLYHSILSNLEKQGIYGIINTSLNGKSEPILEFPHQAIRFFIEHSEIDLLILNNYAVKRKIQEVPTNSLWKYQKIEVRIWVIKKLLKFLESEDSLLCLDINFWEQLLSVIVSWEKKDTLLFQFIIEDDKIFVADSAFFDKNPESLKKILFQQKKVIQLFHEIKNLILDDYVKHKNLSE